MQCHQQEQYIREIEFAEYNDRVADTGHCPACSSRDNLVRYAAGHDGGRADGLVGFRTRIAIGREQERAGRPATCFPDRAMAR
jgi:hypothetical protein